MKRRKNFWLVNPAPARARRRRKVATSGRRKAKRRPPSGFRTWKAYMDSIRPNKKGGTVARRRRRRRNAATANPRRRRRRRRNPGTSVAVANPRRRYRRRRNPVLANRRRVHRRRNPRFSVRGVMAQFTEAGKTAVQIVGGKAITRIIRGRVVPPEKKGTYVQVAAELAIATALGYAASMTLGSRVGANLMAGGYVGAIESLIHQIRPLKFVSDALSDDGNPSVMSVPASAAADVAGYVQSLGGYVPPTLQGVGPGSSYSGDAAVPSVRELSFVGA